MLDIVLSFLSELLSTIAEVLRSYITDFNFGTEREKIVFLDDYDEVTEVEIKLFSYNNKQPNYKTSWFYNNRLIGQQDAMKVKLVRGVYDFTVYVYEQNGLKRKTNYNLKVTVEKSKAINFYRGHFYKPTKTFKEAEAVKHIDSWILTRTDETVWNSFYAPSGARNHLRLLYLSGDNVHDPDGDLNKPVNSTPGNSQPQRNNVAWEKGDIAEIRDLHYSETLKFVNWFLRDAENKNYIPKGDNPAFYHLNLNNQSAMKFFYNRMVKWLFANGYLGIFYDNLNTSFRRATINFEPTLQYGVDDSEAYLEAVITHLWNTKRILTEHGATHGLLNPIVGANVQMATNNVTNYEPLDRFKKIVDVLDYVMVEFAFLSNGGDYKGINNYKRDLNKLDYISTNNKWLLAVLPFDAKIIMDANNPAYTSENKKMRFALASALLVGNTKTIIRGGGQSSYSVEIDPPLYQQFRKYGLPLNHYTVEGVVFKRELQNAHLEVNAETHEVVVTEK